MNQVKLTNACRITTGKLDSNEGIENGKYPFFTCAPTPLKIDSYAFDDDAILLAGNNAQGVFHINRYTGKFNAYQRTYVITKKYGYDLDYIFYSLKLVLAHLKKISQGSQTKFLTMNILDSFFINDIPFNEQRNCSIILKLLDKKIQINKEISEELEAMAKTIYDYWFVQFDFPDENGMPYKSSGGKMVWNETLKQEIPSCGGYKADNMSSIAYIKNMSFNPKNNEDELIEHYSIPAYDSGFFPIFEKGCDISSNKYSISKGDILVSKLNPQFKRVWDPYCFTDKAVCSTEFIVYHSTKENSRSYLLSLINSNRFGQLLINNSSSSTGSRKRLSPEDTLKFVFTIPGDDLQKRYHCFVSPYYEKIKINIIENHMLAEIRDFLLPMLMNGQVTIKS